MDSIPNEMLEKVLKCMRRKDLCKMMLVCHKWKNISDMLWNYDDLKDQRLVITPRNVNILSFERVRRIQKLCITDDTFVFGPDRESDRHHCRSAYWKEAFSSLKRLTKLNDLVLEQLNLVDVPTHTFVTLLEELHYLKLYQVKLDSGNGKIWESIEENSHKISRRLELSLDECFVVEDQSAPVIGRVLNHFYCLKIYGGTFCPNFMQEFFDALSKSSSLIQLKLVLVDVSSVDAVVLSKALNYIRGLSLWEGYYESHLIPPIQLQELFRQMSIETRIMRLKMKNVNLEEINPSILSLAINSILEVVLNEVELLDTQVKAILEQTLINTSLQCLSMSMPMSFAKINEDLLYRVRRKIPECNFLIY